MTFAPFTPPEPPRRVIDTTARSITWTSQPTRHVRKPFPRWAKWLIGIAVFIALWWVSMDFRGLVIVLGIFWFFAFGVHPVVHMGRTVHDIFDGDD